MAQPDVFELIDLVMPHYFATLKSHGIDKIRFPERCIVFADHEVPSHSIRVQGLKKGLLQQMKDFGITQFYAEGRHGISHQAIVEFGHAGARNVENILTRTLLPELSAEVLARLADGKSIQSVKASLNTDGLFFFAIN